MTEWLLLIVAGGLVLACGGFVAAEFAIVTVDRSTVDSVAETGDRAAQGVQTALRSLSTQLSGAQLGITITNLAIGFLAEPAIAELVDGSLESSGVSNAAVGPIAIGIGLTLATMMTMVFGELVPKNLALAKPLATARATQAYQRGFTLGMRFPIRLLNGSANAIVRGLGVEPQEELRSARTATELTSLIGRSAAEGTLDPDTAQLMQRSVAFSGLTSGQIMTPRMRMISLGVNEPVNAVIELARKTGHSRFPVVDNRPDNVMGVVHVKHAVAVSASERATTRIGQVVIDATIVPETLGLDPLLSLLRAEAFQMAVVVDEYGGTAGVVTLEDVVEEIVGEIVDEHDRLGAHARRRNDGTWSLSGLLRPNEISGLTGVKLPEHNDYDTVAGLLVSHLGRMPETGDEVLVALPAKVVDDEESWTTETVVLTVDRMDGRRIDRVHLRVRSGHQEQTAAGRGQDG
ncbi:MAG: hemolysin family protein [Actinomycetota bacterium]|nr:hemolysin family protein [Actinomycetota bacterium]